jgi:hypothetical protein
MKDLVTENWCALYMSIICNILPEDALRAIDEGRIIYHDWTKEDIEDIIAMRNQGLRWKEIGDIYCRRSDSIHRTCKYGKERYGL